MAYVIAGDSVFDDTLLPTVNPERSRSQGLSALLGITMMNEGFRQDRAVIDVMLAHLLKARVERA